jgi:hypothetical protein
MSKNKSKVIDLPDTFMQPDPGSAFVFSISLDEKKTETGLILPKRTEINYRNKEKVMVETMRRILIKTGYQFQMALSQPVIKLFGKTLYRILPRPGDEIVRMEIKEMAQHPPIMRDPNTMNDFELYHNMEIRGIIYNSNIKRPWWELQAINRMIKHQPVCIKWL